VAPPQKWLRGASGPPQCRRIAESLYPRCRDREAKPVSRRDDIERELRRLAPRMPPHEFAAVVDHALGSAGLRSASAPSAAWLSLVAYVRHVFTDYDELLREGYDADSARFFVVEAIDSVLAGWGVRRRVAADD
jgi:hypothetical protein